MDLEVIAKVNNFTYDEIEKLLEIFNSFDKDCSGYIDSSELKVLL